MKGNHHTYYHLKDIAFLQHEPLVETFREQRVYERKVKKAKAKKNEERANRLEQQKPDYKLDRLIRERFVHSISHFDVYIFNIYRFLAVHNRVPKYCFSYVWICRYPKFVDALRDLDDCLTMVHLFAALPALDREKVEVKRVHDCRR